MPTTSKVHGSVAPGFEGVADAFAANLSSGAEFGAACAIYVDGISVLDVWGGLADRVNGRPWERDTVVPVFSVSKGVSAIIVLHLATRGLLLLDAPVAEYWPDFAAHGKEKVTVRQALAHRAGVPFIDGEITLSDLANPDNMAARLAAQQPLHVPGSAHVYHAITIGWITGELVRRVTGKTMAQWLAENVAGPLGINLWMGLPASLARNVATIALTEPEVTQATSAMLAAEGDGWKAMTLNGLINVNPGDGLDFNDYALQAVELAGVGLIADARSLAKFYASCIQSIDGVRLLSDAIIEEGRKPISTGVQFGTDFEGPTWGAGVMVPWTIQPMLGRSSFGHDGHGGRLAFAEPESRVSFAYVRNGIPPGGTKDKAVYAVVEALSEQLG